MSYSRPAGPAGNGNPFTSDAGISVTPSATPTLWKSIASPSIA